MELWKRKIFAGIELIKDGCLATRTEDAPNGRCCCETYCPFTPICMELQELIENAGKHDVSIGLPYCWDVKYIQELWEYDKEPRLIAKFESIDYALVHRGGAVQPWVAAYGYDESSNTWSQGHYFTEKADAIRYIAELLKANEQ